VYTAYLDAALGKTCPRTNTAQLAAAMVSAYELTKRQFTVDQRPHYLFTPRDLTQWVLGLLRYELSDESLMEIWCAVV
jgi:dynein heavy chain 2